MTRTTRPVSWISADVKQFKAILAAEIIKTLDKIQRATGRKRIRR